MTTSLDISKLREAEESMEELKRLAARLRETASQRPDAQSPELVAAAQKLEDAADELLKSIQEYRMSIQ